MTERVGAIEGRNVEQRLTEIGVRFDAAEMQEFRRALEDLENMRVETSKALAIDGSKSADFESTEGEQP